MAAGTALGAFGQIQASQAAAANAQFQAQVAANNAAIADQQILDAKERGREEEQRVMAEGSKVLGTTRAALASHNVDLSFGSPLDTIIETSIEIQRDAYRVRRNRDKEVHDLQTRKYNFLADSAMSRAEAKNARTSGWLAGVGTALEGGVGIAKYRASIS